MTTLMPPSITITMAVTTSRTTIIPIETGEPSLSPKAPISGIAMK